jgi:hypothetical protein
MQISLDECVLHLSEHSGDACPGAAVKLHTDKIEEYVEQLIQADAASRHGSIQALGCNFAAYRK